MAHPGRYAGLKLLFDLSAVVFCALADFTHINHGFDGIDTGTK